MRAYYSEFDPHAAAWLRELIAAGLIPDGDVDERSITEVRAADLAGFRQCHFFCGISGWPLALQLAGWPRERECWSGSPPCQPFSSAARGRARGLECDRHLWPELRRLVAARSPRVLFGEQVAHAGRWFDGVCDDLEGLGYSVGAAVLPACGVGLDHARPRIFFVGHADRDREPVLPVDGEVGGVPRGRGQPRRVVPPHGVPGRMALLRGFGNAVVPQVAAEFVRAFLDVTD